MKKQLMAVSSAAALAAGLSGLGGTALAAPAQQPDEDVAPCLRGEWESTDVTAEHPGMADFDLSGGDGVRLTIDEDGSATVDFTRADRATFEGEAHGQTMRGYFEYRGEATGTVDTDEADDTSGTLRARDVDWQDVELTVVLTEPVDSRPLDRVPVDELRDLAGDRGHMATFAPVLTESTYECQDDTLTLTATDDEGGDQDGQRHDADLTWTFERTE